MNLILEINRKKVIFDALVPTSTSKTMAMIKVNNAEIMIISVEDMDYISLTDMVRD